MKNDQKSLLTIIIPFLNEGEEILNTVRSIKDTSTRNLDILLINDASTDGYDYESLALQEGCRYIVHKERMGVAASRNEGVDCCTSPYFLLIDGHMRFYDKGWDVRLVRLLQDNPRSVLCAQTRKLEKDSRGEIINQAHRLCYGAYIDMGSGGLFHANWCYVDPTPSLVCSEIVCMLGAAYACSCEYWRYLHGLEGLKYYGGDEELLSVKVWCEGGKCLLVKDWIVGHIYRCSFPYTVPKKEIVYNRLFIIELFFPYPVKRILFLNMQKKYGILFEEAYELLRENYQFLNQERKYLSSITQRSIDGFITWNAELEELSKIIDD